MAKKYHIKDDGTPGECTAATTESCPKTQAGDGFHGTAEEVALESQRRFEEKLGAFITVAKGEAAESAEKQVEGPAEEETVSPALTRDEQISAIIDEYAELRREHGAEEDMLRTRVNKSRSTATALRAKKAYDQFLERSGWRVKRKALQDRADALGFDSISELHASRSFAQRAHGNGNAPLPPRIPRDALIPYSFGSTRGWLTAQVSPDTGNEFQFFLHPTENGEWVSKLLNRAQDPIGNASRMEIRPDNLSTFRKEIAAGNGANLQKPVGPIDGKYPLDPSSSS